MSPFLCQRSCSASRRLSNSLFSTVLECPELLSLRRDLKRSLRSAYSSGTYSNLRTQFKAYILFCSYFKLRSLPASLDTLCLYVQFLSRTLTPPSIRNYLSGVKLYHLFSGQEYQFSKEFVLSLALRGISRTALHTPCRAPPVTPDLLLRISRTLDHINDPFECTIFCAFLFTFFLMARVANIVPKSSKKFDPARDLTRGDVLVGPHGLIITFKCTKTIQFGERRLHIPLLSIPDSPLCPVSAYARMVKLVPASSQHPLFVVPMGTRLHTITSSRFISEFRKSLRNAGVVAPTSYRGHSFRRGAASWAFSSGVPGELIQLYGDWASDAYKLYLEFSIEAKLSLAQILRQSISSALS